MNFSEIFSQFEEHLPPKSRGGNWYDWRNNRRSLLARLKFPTQRDEAWKYLGLKRFENLKLQIPFWGFPLTREMQDKVAPHKHFCCHSLVFLDGEFRPELSDLEALPKGVSVIPLMNDRSYDWVRYKEFDQEFMLDFNTTDPVEKNLMNRNYFSFVNDSLTYQGLALHVKADCAADKPIQILHFHSAPASQAVPFSNARVVLRLEKNSKLTLVEEHRSEGNVFDNSVLEAFVDNGARFELTRIQNQHNSSTHINSTRIRVGKDAHVETFNYSVGAAFARHNLDILLKEEGSFASVNGLYISRNSQLVDNHTQIDHFVPNCTSRQLYKGLVDDQSKAVFDGRILIHKNAQKSDTAQLNGNLLLGPNAEANTKPNLEIYADDVKATHGAALGKLSEEEIFYFLSRGIDRKKAVQMLSYGYVGETLEKISSPMVKNYLEKFLKQAFDNLSVGANQ